MPNTTRSTLNASGRSEEKAPRSQAWLLMGIAFTITFIAFILSFIAFFSPFWIVELNAFYTTGLWGRCDSPDTICIWFMERDFAWEKSIPDWHVAAQVLYSIGIGLLFIALMLAVGQLIFRCCKMFFMLPIFIGFIILIATVFELLSITVFGIGAYRTFEVSLNSWVGRFEWAFYVGIAALFIDSLAGVVFIHAGRKYLKEMRGYDTPYAS
jgi:hypothetical protein